MSIEFYGTYFVDTQGQRLGDAPGLLPIPLRQGMEITIHSYSKIFKVIDWKFHHGHSDKNSGLTIILE